MGIVPSAGHMVHMPGHIWLALGDFENTVAVNERAVEVDRKYFAETGVSGAYEMYYLHNLDFLLYARTMQGRAADSKKVIADFATALAPMRSTEMAEMADVFSTLVGLFQIRLQEWDALLAAAKPKSDVGAAFWHFSRAFAYYAKHDDAKARAEQSEFETLAKTLPKDIPWSANKLGDVVELATAALAARLEPSPKSIPLWKHAVELQDALIYDEPPAWYYPIRESLGAELLLSGDAPAAEEVFREGLRRSPNNGRMLFGLLESLTAQKKTEAAKWVRQQFEAAWRGADTKLALKDL
jgi:tetratricopeptide (TPR) repeat protein